MPASESESVEHNQIKREQHTRFPDLKVDTEPIEFRTTKQLPLRGNSALYDVHPSFADVLRGVLEVDYVRFCVCDQNVENSEPAMNDAGIVYPFHHVDDIQPLKARMLEWV